MTRTDKSRQIIERIVVEGKLELITPTSLSNGDADGLTDISLIKDEISEHALLTGTSVCGALRNYLREYEKGFNNAAETDVVVKIFGSHEDDGSQSLLIIDDAISSDKPKTELRDGVKIDGKTRTAVDKAKFDLELLETGTKFPLRFELLICEGENRNEFVSAMATALQGFENGEIYLGGRKRRGYGECEVKGWKVKSYDLKVNLLEWLRNNDKPLNEIVEKPIAAALGVAPNADNRNYFQLDATFAIDGSILIRSGSKISDKYQLDAVHLRSNEKPIISGTSLAGALRHRAVKICNTITDNSGELFVEKMFGVDMEVLKERNKEHKKKGEKPETPFSSRLEVKEKTLDIDKTLVQTRVKIDRFTGGAFDSALFDAAPIFSDGKENAVTLSFKLRFKHDQKQTEKDAEISLLLLLLKDLWTSDLAIGGESSIGRGRLKGISACLNYKNVSGNWAVCLSENTSRQIEIIGNKTHEELNDLVKRLDENLNGKEQT